MSSIPMESPKIVKSFRVGTKRAGLYTIPVKIKHVGKTEHKLYIRFAIRQSENSSNDINFYVMNEQQYFDWQNLVIPKEHISQVYNPAKDTTFKLKRTPDCNTAIDIHADGTAHLVFDNRFSNLTRKNIDLEYYQEWSEEIKPNNILTTIPPEDESLKDEIERMIDESKESLMIISPYCDMSMINNLIKAKEDGVNIKIILRNDEHVKGLAKDGLEQIRKYFPENHKLLKNIHSRIIICDYKEAIVSSADLDQKSLQGLLNLGVKISEPELVKKIIDYFAYIWSMD